MIIEHLSISRRRLALILGALAMLGPFSIDTIFPAFAVMENALAMIHHVSAQFFSPQSSQPAEQILLKRVHSLVENAVLEAERVLNQEIASRQKKPLEVSLFSKYLIWLLDSYATYLQLAGHNTASSFQQRSETLRGNRERLIKEKAKELALAA